ncbi:MAG TPA: right-handed parallel beta-helix repeat-containing protein [Candidatus Polarisedimenticolaceae bacterium]|nr:right-handed parallel beta-helix repeat-containing protein [Candidatus Polarisedimenticolaceae bacterium]
MRRYLASAVLGGVAAAALQAATLEVRPTGPGYTTIQAAIDAAVPGQDDVLVHCGRYFEHVTLRDGVPVRGYAASCAMIDGSDSGVAVTIPHAGSSTVLSGLTITRGHGTRGGGILVAGGAPVITRNVIAGNGSAANAPNGAGIYAWNDGDASAAPTISFNVIRDNVGNAGGGLCLVLLDGAVVTSNVIAGNTAPFGGGAYAWSSTVQFTNNTVVFNTADYAGGLWGADVDAVLQGNLLAFNTSPATAGDVFFVGTSTLSFQSNDTWGNDPFDAYPGGMPGPGNFSADPRLRDTNGGGFHGYEPRSDSPLIDAAAAGAPAADLRGLAAPVDGDASGIARRDVGARENEGLTGLRAPERSRFIWDPGRQLPPDYRGYRGDLQVLRQTGVYTQNPAIVPGARHFCDIGPELIDVDTPAPGQGYFYLAVAWGTVEGTLGFDAQGLERPRTLPCQGP